MGATSRRENVGIANQLFEDPCRFDFFQAVRLLEYCANKSPGRSDKKEHLRVGYDLFPREEPVRFLAHASQSFPPSSIVAIELPSTGSTPLCEDARPANMTVAFMGLTGPQGALPDHYTRLLIDRMRDDDHSMRHFFDLFNHRVISLFYRAWSKYRLFIAYEQAAHNASWQRTDPITNSLFSLVGFGTPHLRNRLELNDQTLLYYSGHLANLRPIDASLVLLLREYFQLPISIDQYQGQWLLLSTEDQSCLGATSSNRRDYYNRLGDSVMLGRRVWDIQSKFRVRLGPLNYRDFCSFLPRGRAFTKLGQLVRTYVGPEFDFDLQLVLAASEIPRCRLGCGDPEPSYLGWNVWLNSQRPKKDADQSVFAGSGAPGHWQATPLTES